MQKPNTLVVTATLGNRTTLQKTIDSVNLIGAKRVKHIIIAPTKATEILKEKFPNHEIIAEPINCKGIYLALNYALMLHAKDYKYLTFINDDDYWLSDYKKLFEILDGDSDIDVAYGRTQYVDENGNVIGEQTSSKRYKAFKALLSKNIILFTQQATLMRSELFIKMGGFDENYKLIADTKFWLDAIESGANFQYTNSLCAAYTIQKGQLSSNGNLQQMEHQTLDLNINIIHAFWEKFIFRISNIYIYLQRLLKYKGFKRMNQFFHS